MIELCPSTVVPIFATSSQMHDLHTRFENHQENIEQKKISVGKLVSH